MTDSEWVGTVTVLLEEAGTRDFFGEVVERRQAHLVGVFLRDGHRGKGVGEAMFAVAVRWAREAGVERVRLYVNEGNGRAAAFYRRVGFVGSGVSVEGDEGVVKVEDNGIGISAEMLPQIFDLFTQAEFDSKGSGLGIGLSLVKDLVDLHGGTVQVRSDGIGKGSEFTVRIPLAGPDSARPDRPAPS